MAVVYGLLVHNTEHSAFVFRFFRLNFELIFE